jgi:hypothetical protein
MMQRRAVMGLAAVVKEYEAFHGSKRFWISCIGSRGKADKEGQFFGRIPDVIMYLMTTDRDFSGEGPESRCFGLDAKPDQSMARRSPEIAIQHP